MSIVFRDAHLEAVFQRTQNQSFKRVDAVGWWFEVIMGGILWQKFGTRVEHWWRLSALGSDSCLYIIALCLMLNNELYAKRRDALLAVHKLFIVLNVMLCHKYFILSQLMATRLPIFGGGWSIVCYTSLVFRQRLTLHTPLQLALVLSLAFCNEWLLHDISNCDEAFRHLLPRLNRPFRSISAYLPPPWPGFVETDYNAFVKFWFIAQICGAFLMPTYVIYRLELAARRKYLQDLHYENPDDEMVDWKPSLVFPLSLLATLALLIFCSSSTSDSEKT